MQRVKQLAELALILAGAFMLIEGGYWIAVIGPKANWSIERATFTIETAGNTINIARHVLDKISKASDQQIAYTVGETKALHDTTVAANQAIADLGGLIKRTSSSLNDSLLPQATTTVQKLGATADATTGAVKHLDAVADSAKQDLDALNTKWLSNPALQKYGHEILANTAAASGHVNGIMADAQLETDKFVAPKTGWQRVKAGLSFAVRLGGIVLVKLIP